VQKCADDIKILHAEKRKLTVKWFEPDELKFPYVKLWEIPCSYFSSRL